MVPQTSYFYCYVDDASFADREGRSFFNFDLTKEISWLGSAHVYSLNDYRHDIMRDIQYIIYA